VLTLINGEFRIIGASPDGDSIRFYPTNTDAFNDAHIFVRANAAGGVQLRLDAIDALETHYRPPGSPVMWHQPTGLGLGAGDRLLGLLGFSDVQRDAEFVVTAATPEAVPGCILTQFGDKYGRAVSMAFAGAWQGSEADGNLVFLRADKLHDSVNYQLVAEGLAYPTFYSKLYYDLRGELAAAAVAARSAGDGVWAEDVTLPGLALTDRDDLSTQIVIMPKLFRRLTEYLALDETGGVDLGGLKAFLEVKADRLFTIPDGQATHFDTLIDVQGDRVRLTTPPEQIVFIEG
jgi:endonuclease YncB( thermonuclease family)